MERTWTTLVLGIALSLNLPAQATKGSAESIYKEATDGMRARDYASGEFWFKELRKDYPRDARWAPGLYSVYSATSRWNDALQIAREGLLLTPKDAVAHQRVGFALFRLNRPEEAISIYQTALGVANSNATRAGIHFQMGDARRSMGAFGAAIDEYQKGIALGGRVPIGLALSRAASGDVDGAIREYEAVLQYDPDHPVVLNNLAYAFANKGIHLDRALSMSQRSRVLEPGNTFNADTLGWIYFKLGRLEDAESTLMEGMRLEGGTRGTVLDHLAAVMDARNVWTPDRRELRQLLVQDLTARQVAKVKELLGRVRAQ